MTPRRLLLSGLVTVTAVLLFFGTASTAGAADPEVTGVEVQAPNDLTVGDRFHYIVRVEADNGTEITVAPGAFPYELETTAPAKTSSRSLGNGRTEITVDIEVAAFVIGQVTIPPISLGIKSPDGSTGSIDTPAAQVFVTSVLPQTGEVQLRDLKPQVEIGTASNLGIILAGLAAVLVALLLVLSLIYRLQHPKPATVVAEAPGVFGPEDRARAILEAAGAAFARDRDFVTYYATIAVTIRNYLTERYGFPAFALTTTELQTELGRRGIDRWQSRLVSGLLVQCDAAVYARYMPALERADHDLTAAFEIVEMSRPVPVSAEEPEEVAVS